MFADAEDMVLVRVWVVCRIFCFVLFCFVCRCSFKSMVL